MAFLPDSQCVSVTKLTPRDKTANVNSCGKARQVKTFFEALRMLQLSQSSGLQSAHPSHLVYRRFYSLSALGRDNQMFNK